MRSLCEKILVARQTTKELNKSTTYHPVSVGVWQLQVLCGRQRRGGLCEGMMKPTALALIDRARCALEEAKTIPEIHHMIGMAKAAETYAREVGATKDVILHATEFRVRAERKLGQALEKTPKASGVRGQVRGGTGRGKPIRAVPEENRPEPPTLSDLGVDKKLSSRSQQLAAIPDEEFEDIVEQSKAEADLSLTKVLRAATTAQRREERTQQIIEQSTAGEAPGAQRWAVILADPPWRYEHAVSKSREIENQYPTMTTDEICALPVGSWATDDAVLYLWVTSPKLEEGLRVLHAWGFEYRTCMVWVKDRVGMGYWARQRHELLFIGTRGQPVTPPIDARPDSVIEAPRKQHSTKPTEVYELIERAFKALPKLEVFARQQRDGWGTWGHEV